MKPLRLTMLVTVALCLLLSGAAQSEEKIYRIGILTELAVTNFEEQWRNALRKRGYVEGQNVVLEIRAAREKYSSLPKLAAELVESNVDIILTASTPTAVAAKQATTNIPIVTLSADPIGAGLVNNLAHPGGNVTGILVPLVDLAPKRVQLLKEAVPGLATVAVLFNPQNKAATSQGNRDCGPVFGS